MARDAEQLAGQVERLRALKAQARVNYRQIADAVGVTERQAQRWMSLEAASDIEPHNLMKLAAYFGTTADFIEYGPVDRVTTPDPFPVSQLDRIEAKLDEVLDWLAAARVLAGVEQDEQQEARTAPATGRRRAS